MEQFSGRCRGHQGRPGQARTKIEPSMANQILLPPPGWSLLNRASVNKEQLSGCCRGHQGRPAQKKNDQAWQTKYYCLRRGMPWSQLYLCGQFHFTTHRMINYCEQSLPPLLASPSQFSSRWRIFHTPARTWFSSLQQWLPNQRLHWSLLTSLMTCQLYTVSLQQCLQNQGFLCSQTSLKNMKIIEEIVKNK